MLYQSPMSFCPSFCSLSGWRNYFLTRKVVCKYLHGEQPCINGVSKNSLLVLHGNGYSPAWSPYTQLDVEKCLPILTYFIVGCMKQLPGEFKENNDSIMIAWEVLDYILLFWKLGKISWKISVYNASGSCWLRHWAHCRALGQLVPGHTCGHKPGCPGQDVVGKQIGFIYLFI